MIINTYNNSNELTQNYFHIITKQGPLTLSSEHSKVINKEFHNGPILAQLSERSSLTCKTEIPVAIIWWWCKSYRRQLM